MNLDNIKVPIIVYWDISPLFPINQNDIQRICEELLANKIFVLNILDSSPHLSRESSMILKKLRDENINITLTLNYSALNILDLKSFMPALKKILIQIESIDQIALISDKIQSKKPETPSIEISYAITETTYKNIPDILKLCIETDINNIHFPIQRVSGEQNVFWLDKEKNRWLSKEIKHLQTNGLNINVHDPFLWEIFNKKINQNKSGCQGGNTMVYISGNLDVTPCPLLPIILGNLKSETLTGVFSADKKQQIRKQLSIPPQECGNCDRVNNCIGGCRGRTYLIYRTLNKRDPACHYF
jgi:GeoRSP system SPASM domain protein